MVWRIQRNHSLLFRRKNSLLLAFVWTLGLIGGIYAIFAADHFPVSLMHGFSSETMSIVHLLSLTALPFLFSILAVWAIKPALIMMLCFVKAFLFSYVSLGILQYYGSSGWLIHFLLLFHECASIPILYFFWLRGLYDIGFFHNFEGVLLVSLGLLVGSIDYSIISPFLAHVIDF